jgi:hypothetical protein
MKPGLLYGAAAVLTTTAFVHAFLGERRLIGPILALDAPVVRRPMARALIRFAWHLTSVLMLIVALVQFRSAADPAMADGVVLWVIGVTLVAVGLLDAALTRFKHIGWPALTAAGALTLLAL